jgi:predicted PurR-regulated permease PerM
MRTPPRAHRPIWVKKRARRRHTVAGTMNPQRDTMFSTPTWLRDLGFASWLLVGFVLIIVGVVWLLGQTSTIVMPVILAGILGAVAGPLVDTLQGRKLPRAAGAGLVLLGLVAIAALVVFLVVHGITANSGDAGAQASKALDKIEGSLKDAGVDTANVKADVKKEVPEIGQTLIHGVAAGISGLGSLVFFLSFAALATFFVLKDGPVMSRFVTRHMGLPVPVAAIVAREVASGLRNYFTGVTIVAAFNAVVVGLGALILGVPLAGTIAVVTFVTAYVPYIGAWTAGIFAFVLALGSQGATDALILALVIFLANGLLQNLLQPFVFGATLSLNPLAVLIVTIGAGCLFGMVGLTLAAPLTSAAVHISQALRQQPADAVPESESVAATVP